MAGNVVAPAATQSVATTLNAPSGVMYRRNTSGPINPGAGTTLQIETGNKFRFLALRLQYTLTQPATPVAITPSNILAGDEFGIIKSLVIKTTDNDYIVDANAMELIKVYNRLCPRHKPVLPALKNAGTGSPVIDSTLIIPFWMLDSKNHVETSLNTSRILAGQLNCVIQWGTVANVTSIAGASLTGALTVELRSLETYGGSIPTIDMRINKMPLLNIASGALRQTTNLDVAQNLEYWGLLVHEYITNGADNANILSRFAVRNGGVYYLDAAPISHRQTLLQTAAVGFTGFDGDAYSNGEILDYSSSTVQDAWTFYPFAWDGYKTEDFQTAGKSSLKMEYDCNTGLPANAAVDVYGFQIFRAA